jgi:glycosyltransferase involved in cell wall biosynthesis
MSIRNRQGVPSIAYFTQMYPGLTQTFIYREVLALRARQVPVTTYSVWPPETDDLPPEVRPLVDETFYIFPMDWVALLLAHLWCLFSRPLRYLGTLTFVLTRPGTSLRNRWRTLLHFCYGIPVLRDMERQGIQHIHVHFAWSASSIALIAHRILDIPFSLTLHSNEIYFDRLLLKYKLEAAHFVVTISEFNRRLLEELWPESGIADKVHVIHCGLDPDLFQAARDTATPGGTRTGVEESDSKNDEIQIVGVGQLAPRKGFHVLIEACGLLSQRNVPYRCHIFGEGPERDRLEALQDQYGLHKQIQMPGRIYQQDLRRFLAQSDIFCLPCVQDKSGDLDGIPVVLMEAMAMELATVSTRVSGIPELIQHEQNGLLADPDDVQALADILQELASDPQRRTRLAQAGRATVIQDFNIHHSAEQMAALFETNLD